MCKFKSAIVLRNGILLHNLWTDSHEDIIEENNLVDNGKENFVRIGFYPNNDKELSDISKYKLHVDENETPDWFDEKMRDSTEKNLYRIVSKMIITEDINLITNKVVILSKGVTVNKIKNTVVIAMFGDSNVINMYNNSKVTNMMDNSKITYMWDNSEVIYMVDNSNVINMYNNSKVTNMYNDSKVTEMYNDSQVINNNTNK